MTTSINLERSEYFLRPRHIVSELRANKIKSSRIEAKQIGKTVITVITDLTMI